MSRRFRIPSPLREISHLYRENVLRVDIRGWFFKGFVFDENFTPRPNGAGILPRILGEEVNMKKFALIFIFLVPLAHGSPLCRVLCVN